MSSPSEKHEAMFAAMISGYATQAMVGLGKIANPMSGEIERDLNTARAMIDILEMLEAKTEGNRTEPETSALRQALSTLRLNFVEEVNRPEAESTSDGTEAESTDSETENAAADATGDS